MCDTEKFGLDLRYMRQKQVLKILWETVESLNQDYVVEKKLVAVFEAELLEFAKTVDALLTIHKEGKEQE